MPLRIVVAHDENLTAGWSARTLESVLDIPADEATKLVMALYANGWADLGGEYDNLMGTAVTLAGLGLDVRIVRGEMQ